MRRLGLIDGRNAHLRIAALVRVAIVPILVLNNAFEWPTAAPDLPLSGPLHVIGAAYALLALVYAFTARRDAPLAPFAVLDLVLVGLIGYGEGGATADMRFA
jgi:hypothetical protein